MPMAFLRGHVQTCGAPESCPSRSQRSNVQPWEGGVSMPIVLCKSLQWEGAEEKPFSDYCWSYARTTFSSKLFFLRKCWILQTSFPSTSLQRTVTPLPKLGVPSHFGAGSFVYPPAGCFPAVKPSTFSQDESKDS